VRVFTSRSNSLRSGAPFPFIDLRDSVMPQPLRRRVNLDFNPANVSTRAVLGMKIAHVVAHASLLETRLSGILAMLSGGNPEVTMAMFLAVNSTDAQRAMLRSAAEATLDGQELEALCDLLDEYRNRARERNKIIHGAWATCAEFPDALLLARTADIAAMHKRLALFTHQRGQFPDLTDGVWQNCMIYREQDFDQVIARLSAFDLQIIGFWTNLMNRHKDSEPIPEQASLLPEE
jgi:hypothetical protein